MTSDSMHPRDLVGYGAHPPDPQWPNGARIVVSVVLNYEEGGEYSILHGDAHSETALTDTDRPSPLFGVRNLNIESIFEYGSRVGFWEVMRLLRTRQVDATIYAVGMALERTPEAAATRLSSGSDSPSMLSWRRKPRLSTRPATSSSIRSLSSAPSLRRHASIVLWESLMSILFA